MEPLRPEYLALVLGLLVAALYGLGFVIGQAPYGWSYGPIILSHETYLYWGFVAAFGLAARFLNLLTIAVVALCTVIVVPVAFVCCFPRGRVAMRRIPAIRWTMGMFDSRRRLVGVGVASAVAYICCLYLTYRIITGFGETFPGADSPAFLSSIGELVTGFVLVASSLYYLWIGRKAGLTYLAISAVFIVGLLATYGEAYGINHNRPIPITVQTLQPIPGPTEVSRSGGTFFYQLELVGSNAEDYYFLSQRPRLVLTVPRGVIVSLQAHMESDHDDPFSFTRWPR